MLFNYDDAILLNNSAGKEDLEKLSETGGAVGAAVRFTLEIIHEIGDGDAQKVIDALHLHGIPGAQPCDTCGKLPCTKEECRN